MKTIIKALIYCTLVFLISCNDEVITDPLYPTIVKTMSDRDWISRNSMLENSALFGCTLLNDYGFFSTNMKNTQQCKIKDSVQSAFTLEELTVKAKEAAVRFSSILGVADTSFMQIESVVTLKGISYTSFRQANPDSFPNSWQITFKPQIYNNFEVRGTKITMVIDTLNVVMISGNWFQEIYVPQQEKFNESRIKELLINQKLTYKNRAFVPDEDTQWRLTRKIIVPMHRSKQIELRVCLALYSGSWEVIVDTETGERLSAIDLSS